MSRSDTDEIDAATYDPGPEEKAAFVKAMYRGVGTAAEEAPRAEVVRRIPAPPATAEGTEEPTEESRLATDLVDRIEAALDDGDLGRIPAGTQQALAAAVCRLFAANRAAGRSFDILGPGDPVAATDAMVTCGALLDSVDVAVFELALWQSWGGR